LPGELQLAVFDAGSPEPGAGDEQHGCRRGTGREEQAVERPGTRRARPIPDRKEGRRPTRLNFTLSPEELAQLAVGARIAHRRSSP
jgi:hypothetical protein